MGSQKRDKTDDNKKLFLELLPKKNYNISKTCKACKISRATFYVWKGDDKEFADKVKEMEEADIDDSEEKMRLLRQGVPDFDKEGKFVGWKVKPHFGALLAHLESKAKKRGWGKSVEITTGANEDAMTEEEIMKRLDDFRKELEEDDYDTSNDV